ncbi:MAG: DEAD/DEAH box helicase family protein [Dehalococcoidia bacterium]|jgi:hypothetical protein|nr:DEAD/DEAH box helicase family protein [Dehalococcoidia bacterium]
MALDPEQQARVEIDRQLAQAGWVVQDRDEANLYAARGVAIREFPMKSGHGFSDYLLFVDGQAVGALEAKKVGTTLSGVEPQGEMYSEGLPDALDAPVRPLPFIYLSTGTETGFFNGLDPEPRSRRLYTFHRPETLAEWLAAESLGEWAAMEVEPSIAETPSNYLTRPSTLRSRLREMPPAELPGMWPNQIQAVRNLEESFAADRPRALIQMATGSGKTYSIELWETGGGAALATLASGVTLTPEVGTVVSVTWDASLLGTADGSAVELRIVGTASVDRSVEVGAVEWGARVPASGADLYFLRARYYDPAQLIERWRAEGAVHRARSDRVCAAVCVRGE